MLKHKLFVGGENSPQFNSSLDDGSGYPQIKSRASKANSKAVEAVENGLEVEKNGTASEINFTVPENDSDFNTVSGFFSSNNQKIPYSYQEDEEIVKYVLKGQSIFKVSSILLWKHLEHLKKNPKRTYQSLKNRFLRNIKPYLFTTFRHLIQDEDTAQKILTKFPELKKQFNQMETLPKIVLLERNTSAKISEGSVPSTSFREQQGNLAQVNDDAATQPAPAPSTSHPFSKLDFHRKVELNGNSLTVLVNLNFEHPAPPMMRIYERYWNLKSKNKLIPCSACGRCGGAPENDFDSGAESDAFISNSVESGKLVRGSPKKKSITRKNNKRVQSQKKKKKSLTPEFYNNRRSCSPSLLEDVNEVNELDSNAAKNFENENVAAETDSETVKQIEYNKEAEPIPLEASSISTESIYQKTVTEFRKLIDSDEEEILVKKCLKKNRKSIGFDANLSVENMQVDSYFVKSSSPGLESTTASDSTARNKFEGGLNRPLAENMMKMLRNGSKI